MFVACRVFQTIADLRPNLHSPPEVHTLHFYKYALSQYVFTRPLAWSDNIQGGTFKDTHIVLNTLFIWKKILKTIFDTRKIEY